MLGVRGGRLLAVVAVAVGTLSCERHQRVVIGFAFGATSPSVLDIVRAGQRDSGRVDAIEFVGPTSMTLEPGAPGQVSMAGQFAAMRGIVAVVGHADSRSTLAAAPVYDEAKIPVLVPTSTSRRLRTVSPWVFMMAPDDSAEAVFLATFVAQTLHARTASVFYDNDEYGVGLRDFLRSALGGRGARVIAEEPIGSFCDAGGQAEASLLRATPRDHPPGVVIVAGRSAQTACIVRRVYERLTRTPIVAGDAVEPDSSFVTTLGAAARNFYAVVFWYPTLPGAASAAFAQRFEARMGAPPHASHALLFDAVSLIEAAVRDVGARPEAIRRYLAELGRSRPPYPGVTGAVAFGDFHRPMYMVRVAKLGATPVLVQ